MKHTRICLLVMILFLGACQPSGQSLPAGITPSQLAISTATPAPVSSLDLSSVILSEGDLPSGYAAAEINLDLGEMVDVAPSPDAFFSQDLAYNQQGSGFITLLLYEEETRIPQAYSLLADAMPGEKRELDIGEIGTVANISPDAVMLTFMRCHAVITIQLSGAAGEEELLSYAARLDQRISPLICRGGSHE